MKRMKYLWSLQLHVEKQQKVQGGETVLNKLKVNKKLNLRQVAKNNLCTKLDSKNALIKKLAS